MNWSGIIGTGSFVPAQKLSTKAIEKRAGVASGTIVAALGIEERRFAPPELAVSDLAVEAGKLALADAGVEHVDLVILATSTPDHPVPATAPQVAHRLGQNCPAFDLMNTCSGWSYAVEVANRWLQNGRETTALVIGANVLSRRLNWNDWPTSGQFADGAGAVVLKRNSGGKIHASALLADGSNWQHIQIPAGGTREPITAEALEEKRNTLQIARAVGLLDSSIERMEKVASEALELAGWSAADVDLLIPHQSNSKMIEGISHRLGFARQKVITNFQTRGNTSAASIPIAFDEARKSGKIERGQKILSVVSAAGMTAGALCWEAP